VKQLRAEITVLEKRLECHQATNRSVIEGKNAEIVALQAELEALKRSNKSLTLSNNDSNKCLTAASDILTQSNKFDKRAYQREYMRKRRATGK